MLSRCNYRTIGSWDIRDDGTRGCASFGAITFDSPRSPADFLSVRTARNIKRVGNVDDWSVTASIIARVAFWR